MIVAYKAEAEAASSAAAFVDFLATGGVVARGQYGTWTPVVRAAARRSEGTSPGAVWGALLRYGIWDNFF